MKLKSYWLFKEIILWFGHVLVIFSYYIPAVHPKSSYYSYTWAIPKKSKQGELRIWNFQGYQRNNMQ